MILIIKVRQFTTAGCNISYINIINQLFILTIATINNAGSKMEPAL